MKTRGTYEKICIKDIEQYRGLTSRKTNAPGPYSCVYFLFWALLRSENDTEVVTQ